MHVQRLPAPIVLITPSGEDSLLVYTYENVLYHYVISVADAAVTLVQVGQIALHGIIRAPPRVRALSWILPEDQIRKVRGTSILSSTDKYQIMAIHRKMWQSPPYSFLLMASSSCSSLQQRRAVNSNTRCASLPRMSRRMRSCEITPRSL
jgi:hypothetical protein